MRAQMWLSLFRVGSTPESGRADREPGVYGAAFVVYEPGSPLTYRELVVARLVDPRRRVLTITDIWVDSIASRDGGRSLWAIPKDLGRIDVDDRRLGPSEHTEAAAHVDGRQVAKAGFASLPGASLLRTPFAVTASQRHEVPVGGGGESRAEVLAPIRGTARSLPALATWEFDAAGPLGYLAGRRPMLSFRLTDVRLTFG